MESDFDVTGENCKWRSSELASTWCDIVWVATYMKVWCMFSSCLYFYLYCVCILNSSMYKCWTLYVLTETLVIVWVVLIFNRSVLFFYFFIVLRLVTLYTSFVLVLLLLLDCKQGLKSHWTMAPEIGPSNMFIGPGLLGREKGSWPSGLGYQGLKMHRKNHYVGNLLKTYKKLLSLSLSLSLSL